MDGLYGSIAIRQAPSKDPNSNLYDFDLTTHVMLISDWLHEDAAERFPGRLAVNTGKCNSNPNKIMFYQMVCSYYIFLFYDYFITGQDPESLLINGKGQFRDPNTGFMTNTPLEVFTITPGRRYRFRMINSFASVCPAQLTFQGHRLSLIATDGEPVHPVQVDTVISFSGKWNHLKLCGCTNASSKIKTILKFKKKISPSSSNANLLLKFYRFTKIYLNGNKK